MNSGPKDSMAEEFLNACFEGNVEGVRAALQSGVDVNTRDSYDSERARLSGVSQYLAKGKTGLMWAVMRKHNSVVELLLSIPEIDINAEDSKPQMTALDLTLPSYFSNDNNNPEGLALLLAHEEVEVNHMSQVSGTPLFDAVMSGAMESVQLLLSHPRVNPNMGTVGTPLIYTVKKSNEAAVLESYI